MQQMAAYSAKCFLEKITLYNIVMLLFSQEYCEFGGHRH